MSSIKFVYSLLIVSLFSCSQTATNEPSFTEDFNSFPVSEKVKNYNHSNQTIRGRYTISRHDGQVGFGSILDPTENFQVPHRAEFTSQLDEFYNENDEIWIGFDFLVPSTYDLDLENDGNSVVIFQIHSKPTQDSSWPEYNKNLPFNRPSIALQLIKKGEEYELLLRYGLNGKPNTEFAHRKWVKAFRKKISPDKWHKIVFNFKLSLHDEDGYIATWVDSDDYKKEDFEAHKVYGANMHNEAKPYMKMGLYRYWTDSNTHEVFYDNLTITGSREEFLKLYHSDR